MASSGAENCKTWVLRVSIHCQGCKRKVNKLLQSVPGVHSVEIETRLQRVVVTGDVSPDTLIRKLVKAGKHAELWPVKPPEICIPKTDKPSVEEESAGSGKEIKPTASKTENPVEDPSKIGDTSVPGGGKVDEGVGKSEVAGGDGKVAVEVKVEEKKPETGSAGNQASQPVVEEKEEQTEKENGVVCGGSEPSDGGELKKKKKKKKEGQNGDKNVIGETSSSAPPPVTGRSAANHGGDRLPSNQSPPRHHGYQYQYPPPHYHTPPPPPAPVYTMSYNTAHPPVNSFTASHYAAPAAQSYAYSHFRPEMEGHPAPSDVEWHRQQQPLDSFEMFSDENPNGCLVM